MKGLAQHQSDHLYSQFFLISEKRKNWVVTALVSFWLISTVYAFWWFQFSNIRIFDPEVINNRTVFFESGSQDKRLEKMVQSQLKNTGKSPLPISLVHFWDPDCPCNRFNEAHV